MSDNLLSNSNFEKDWGEGQSHRCLVLTDEGAHFTDIENIFVPPDWTFWFRHRPGEFDQPEGRDAWATNDPVRVHSGDKAYMYFTFCRRHDAGLYQQVQVTPGTKVRFTAYAHAWSSHPLEGHESCRQDPHCSMGVGAGAHFLLEGDAPGLNGDPWNDAIGNFTFWLGIDPTGGIDPLAGTVVWSRGAHIYNVHAEVPAVEAHAEVTSVTVFLRSTTLWAFENNDAYWDSANLETVYYIDPPPLPPAPDDELGQPREQYERTYVLLPPSADELWAEAVIDATWDEHRYTLGGSADDAGIGDLDARRVIAVNPGEWPSDLTAFYEEYYPGVELILIDASTPEVLRAILSPPSQLLMCQIDPLWSSDKLAGIDCNSTLGGMGCYVSGLAIVQRILGIDPYATPATVNQALGPYGFNGCDVKWSAAETALGILISRTEDAATARAHLDTGRPVLAEVSPTTYLHFVVVTRHEAGRYWMLDPYKCVEGWLDDHYPGVDSWRLLSPTSTLPPAPPSPPCVYTLRGVHDLAGGDWLVSEGLEGWVTEAVYLDGYVARELDLQKYTNAGLQLVIRLSFSYATRDGGQGTVPAQGDLDRFEAAILGTMEANKHPNVCFAIGNEMNNASEWHSSWVLTPDAYMEMYNRLWSKKGDARLAPGAIDPTNAGWGDWRIEWGRVLNGITGADAMILHAYTHGPDLALIWHDKEFGDAPLLGCYYDLRMLETQQAVIPARFAGLPQIVTEANHLFNSDGLVGWENPEWIGAAYEYFATRGVAGVCLFRFNYDDWNFGSIPAMLEELKKV